MVKRLVFHGHNNFHAQVRSRKNISKFILLWLVVYAASVLVAVAGALVWFQLLKCPSQIQIIADQTRTDCSESRALTGCTNTAELKSWDKIRWRQMSLNMIRHTVLLL